ncbi:WD40/YVTN/BNR-like repeat-containing protein [Bythopirellula goksoeyrii]|uniref:BNR/Asp-box repeat protein n=1 Tax=Bythopirellula goksoeyrii TaxID=1400387 RepID=A0A5B9QU94_9BACT|nr:sialidase family protein [Bythopirellula goksoeyrii]QEG37493.1 BNR/Asp-box repeat protein [Bythopirellula goksoeyrii]
MQMPRYYVGVGLVLFSGAVANAVEEHAVFKSLDGGQSWVRFDTGIPQTTRTNTFGCSGEILFAGTDSGLFFIDDRSQPWKAAGGLATSSGRIISIATAGSNVFVGTADHGMLVSTDKGKSWVRNASLPVQKVRSLLLEDGRLYAGADTKGVFVSDDNGVSWRKLGGGLPVNAQVFDLAVVKGKLFAGLYSKGLYVWNDGNSRWTKSGNVSPLVLASSGDTLIAGHNPGGLYWSDDLGDSWFKGTGKNVGGKDKFPDILSDAPVWEAGANDKRAFAGASDGIYVSKDHGRNWTRTRRGLPKNGPGIAFLVTNQLVLASTVLKHDPAE